MSDYAPVSVVVCARNEESRIARALEAVIACAPDEIIVVDGGSTDRTVEIANDFLICQSNGRIIRSGGRGLAYDRQLGAEAAANDYVVYIDADHRPRPDDLNALLADMADYGFDAIQAGVGIEDNGFWCRAENDAFAVFHHKPGPRKQMIGVAPAIFKKDLLMAVPFDTDNPDVSDDADLFARIVAANRYTFGVGRTVIAQEHHGRFADYVDKFAWYGRMDAAFMVKHPHRAHSMLFHLLVRYPVWRPLMALLQGRPRAVPYFWLCAAVRTGAAARYLAARPFKKSQPREAAA